MYLYTHTNSLHSRQYFQQHKFIDAKKLESRNRFNEPVFIQQQQQQQKSKIFIIMK